MAYVLWVGIVACYDFMQFFRDHESLPFERHIRDKDGVKYTLPSTYSAVQTHLFEPRAWVLVKWRSSCHETQSSPLLPRRLRSFRDDTFVEMLKKNNSGIEWLDDGIVR